MDLCVIFLLNKAREVWAKKKCAMTALVRRNTVSRSAEIENLEGH
jgi:hypothetical protein